MSRGNAPADRLAQEAVSGCILLAEHVRSHNRIVRGIRRLLDPLAHRFGGDHLLREPLELLAEEGFEVERVERRKAGFVELVAARKPKGPPAHG